MNRWASAVCVALVVVLGLAEVAMAQRGGRGTFITTNLYDNLGMWVTIYDSNLVGQQGSIVEAGCVPPKRTKNFVTKQGGGYPLGAKHYVRAEITRNPNCQHPLAGCDRTITAVPSLGNQTLKMYPHCEWRIE